jgi:hypothetical protein
MRLEFDLEGLERIGESDRTAQTDDNQMTEIKLQDHLQR